MILVVMIALLSVVLFGAGFAFVGAIQLIGAAVWAFGLWRRGRRAIAGRWRLRGREWTLERADGSTVVVSGPLSRVALTDGAHGGAVGRSSVIPGAGDGPYRTSAAQTIVEVRGAEDVYLGDLPFAPERDAARREALRGARRLGIGAAVLVGLVLVLAFLVRVFIPVGCG